MRDSVQVQCPFCFEWQELDLDPSTEGAFVQDCDVCCRPWQVHVEWDEEGEPRVEAGRS